VTVNGGDGGSEPVPLGLGPSRNCSVASGPSYSPTGTIPVTTSGGRKSASFTFAATFTTNARAGSVPSCCSVRQYIKWDRAYHGWHGGPPHGGFPSSATFDTWYEDRDGTDGLRYGHRSGPHCVPTAHCGNEYKTGATQDMASGDTYCGSDFPGGAATNAAGAARTGHYYFQLKVIDTCNADAEKASSSVIDVDWSR
jgi:hypothetical protein